MKRKTLAMLLTVAMMTGCLAGCGNEASTGESGTRESAVAESAGGEEATGEEEPSEEASGNGEGIAVDAYAGTTLTIAVFKHTLDSSDDFNEKPGFKAAEEATGVHINWIEVEQGTESERKTTMLTGDMPDAFLGLLGEGDIAANMDLFYDLSEEGLLETYAPNVLADHESIEGGLQNVTWPDGSIRSLMGGIQVSYNDDPSGIMVINKAWLDKLDMDVPTTADEFYTVMKAFKENDMNGNGDPNDEIPLEFCEGNWAAHICNLANPWGIAGEQPYDTEFWRMVKNGKVVPTLTTDEFRAFLEYYNRMAEEGLLDVEGFSQTNEQYYSKLKEGVVGCYIAWTPRSNMTREEADNWVAMPPFTAIEGVKPVKTGERDRLTAGRTVFVASAKCENIEALLTWWNYLSSSTEMKYTVSAGEKGGTWDIEDGKVVERVFTEVEEGVDYGYTYGVGGSRCPLIRKDELAVLSADMENDNYYRQTMVDVVWDYLQTEYMPVKFTDAEKVNERSFMEIELVDLVNNFISNSIVNGITDETWNTFQEQLEANQYPEWIAWWQKYYDGEF